MFELLAEPPDFLNEEGYVTFVTSNYLPILENLLKSYQRFSTKRLHIFAINFQILNLPKNITSTPIRTDRELSFYNICAAKLFSAINSPFRHTVILDGDTIFTPYSDRLFDETRGRLECLTHPLFCRHPHKYDNTHPRSILIKEVFDRLNIVRGNLRYLYASFTFLKSHSTIFHEAYNLMQSDQYFGEDEVLINALLHKYKWNADIGFCYLVNASLETLGHFIGGNEYLSPKIHKIYFEYDTPVKFYFFHGHAVKDKSIVDAYLLSL